MTIHLTVSQVQCTTTACIHTSNEGSLHEDTEKTALLEDTTKSLTKHEFRCISEQDAWVRQRCTQSDSFSELIVQV